MSFGWIGTVPNWTIPLGTEEGDLEPNKFPKLLLYEALESVSELPTNCGIDDLLILDSLGKFAKSKRLARCCAVLLVDQFLILVVVQVLEYYLT